MLSNHKRYFITYNDLNLSIRVCSFSPVDTTSETHAIFELLPSCSDFATQLQQMCTGIERFLESMSANDSQATFGRCFLSDIANQYEQAHNRISSTLKCPVSIVQQPMLNGSKIGIWLQLQNNVRFLSEKQDKFDSNGYTHCYTTLLADKNLPDSLSQTTQLLNTYVQLLEKDKLKLEKDCLRTWFFARDIDCDYEGVVIGRKDIFTQHGLTEKTHYITSTGIQAASCNYKVKVMLDAYAIGGLAPQQTGFLYAPTHLSPTHMYGVTFERGVFVDFGDRRKVWISGTASIDNRGEILHKEDIEGQVKRMWENVDVLLNEAACKFEDMMQVIVYLRDIGDYQKVKNMFDLRLQDIPYIIVLAPICRPGWLIEMECIAIKEITRPEFPNY